MRGVLRGRVVVRRHRDDPVGDQARDDRTAAAIPGAVAAEARDERLQPGSAAEPDGAGTRPDVEPDLDEAQPGAMLAL